MTDFSPAAQAVLTAATQRMFGLDPEDVPISSSEYSAALAAALRAAADQVAPEPNDFDKDMFSFAALRHRWVIRDRLLAIAAELEGAQ